MIKLAITNLGKYNEGTLIYKWITLPIESDELQEVYKAIGINEQYEEVFITDWETKIEGLEVGEYSNIEDLNTLAEELELLSDVDIQIVEILLEEGYDITQALEKYEDVTYIQLEGSWNQEEDLAESYIEQIYGGIKWLDKETLQNYFDYEKFGRDLAYDFTIKGEIAISNN